MWRGCKADGSHHAQGEEDLTCTNWSVSESRDAKEVQAIPVFFPPEFPREVRGVLGSGGVQVGPGGAGLSPRGHPRLRVPAEGWH